jgi:hypothetical protein
MISLRTAQPTRARLAALALLCAAALGVAACGGGDDASSTSSASTATTTTSDLRAKFDQVLRQNLTGEQGLTPAQADCVITKLQKAVTDAQIEQVVTGGQLSQQVREAAAKAGISCALKNGGG